MKRLIIIISVPFLLLNCTDNPKIPEQSNVDSSSSLYKIIRFDKKDDNEEDSKNYIVKRHDVKIYDLETNQELSTIQPLRKDQTYTIKIIPLDSLDILEGIDFPRENVSYQKINDSIFSFKLEKKNTDTIIGMQSSIKRRKGEYIIEELDHGRLIGRSVVSGIGGFEYFRIK